MEEEAITALASIENLDRNHALALYKQGFRSLDEVAEASEEELGSLDGLGGPANAASLRRRAAQAMERVRLRRLDEVVSGNKSITERDELLLIGGVSARVADLLHHAGYRSVRDVHAEEDIDRLAIRTGIGSKKAQELREAVIEYVAKDSSRVDEGQKRARERQQEADAKLRADAQSRASESDSVSSTKARSPMARLPLSVGRLRAWPARPPTRAQRRHRQLANPGKGAEARHVRRSSAWTHVRRMPKAGWPPGTAALRAGRRSTPARARRASPRLGTWGFGASAPELSACGRAQWRPAARLAYQRKSRRRSTRGLGEWPVRA
jgi:hypothetical protein